MMTVVRIPFQGTAYAGNDVDLVQLLWLGSRPVVMEVVAAKVAMADEDTLVANEHIGLTLLRAYDSGGLESVVLTAGSEGAAEVNYGVPSGDASWTMLSAFDPVTTGLIVEVAVVNTEPPTCAGTLAYETIGEYALNLQIPSRDVPLEEDRPITVLGRNSIGKDEALIWRMTAPPSASVTVRGELAVRFSRIDWD